MEEQAISPIAFWSLSLVITTLLAVVGFFVAYYFRRSMTSTDKLSDSVNKLQNSITGMNGIILANDEKFQSLKNENEKEHCRTERRLNDHAKRIDEHETRISILEKK